MCSQPLYESHPTHKPPKHARTPRACGGGEWIHQTCGGHSIGETPGNIPNLEAKPNNADGTAPDRVWESRKPPQPHHKKGVGGRAFGKKEHTPVFPSNAPPPTPLSHTTILNTPHIAPNTPHANTQPGGKPGSPHTHHTVHTRHNRTQRVKDDPYLNQPHPQHANTPSFTDTNTGQGDTRSKQGTTHPLFRRQRAVHQPHRRRISRSTHTPTRTYLSTPKPQHPTRAPPLPTSATPGTAPHI